MSANPVARPQSKRGILTAALAGLAASGAAYGAQSVLAEPDPVFALIEAERRATERFHAAIDAQDACDDPALVYAVNADWEAASRAQWTALGAVMKAPASPAGIAAAIDLFIEREIDNVARPVDALLLDLFAAIRAHLGVAVARATEGSPALTA